MKTVLFFALLASFAQASPADDVFNASVGSINESVAKIVAAQARRSQEIKAESAALSCTPKEIDAAYASLPLCEAAIKKAFGSDVRDFRGVLSKGFSRGPGLSLVLLTKTDAFFYHEDCDICAAVERCSLKTGALTNFKTAHSVDCGDLSPFLKKDVAYSSCPLRP